MTNYRLQCFQEITAFAFAHPCSSGWTNIYRGAFNGVGRKMQMPRFLENFPTAKILGATSEGFVQSLLKATNNILEQKH